MLIFRYNNDKRSWFEEIGVMECLNFKRKLKGFYLFFCPFASKIRHNKKKTTDNKETKNREIRSMVDEMKT